MLLQQDAGAEEKKGFLIRAWERIRPKKEENPAPVPPPAETVQPLSVDTGTVDEGVPGTAGLSGKEQPQAAQENTLESQIDEDAAMDEDVDHIDESVDMIEDEGTAGSAEKQKPELSSDEMIKVIERRLKSYPQIANFIPGLEIRQGQDGKEEIYYTDKGVIALKLGQLEKESLSHLFGRVNNEAVKINTERIIKQIRQQEELRRQAQQGIPRQPPQPPPRVYTPPPPTPQAYTPPPQPPRGYTPPPQPPRVPRR